MAAAIDYGAGLERLQHLASVTIHQKVKWGKNKYLVNTVDGEILFTMKESGGSIFASRGTIRGFDMIAVDSMERKAFKFRRPTVFSSDKVEVTMGGQVVCIVRKVNTFIKPLFSVNDGNNVPVLRVKGESGYNFQLQTLDKTAIGIISKKYRGVMKEMFSYADDYEIAFPADLELRYKVATIASCILIDYRYHEG